MLCGALLADTFAWAAMEGRSPYTVLSLKSDHKPGAKVGLPSDGPGGPARQTALLGQLHAAQIHVFACQDIRLRRAASLQSERYWLFHALASSK